jgi:uncharacterized protein YbaR (Trm112 family)
MPINEELFEILCCPVTKVGLKKLSKEDIFTLNDMISFGLIKDISGSIVEDPIEDGLITEDWKTIYLIKDDIPIMLAEESIPTSQLGKEILNTIIAHCSL